MHSSRLRTVRSSSRQLWGGSVSVHAGIHHPLGVGLETPPPPGVGLETPQRCGPGVPPTPWCRPGDPPLWPDPSTSPPPRVWAWRLLSGQTPQLPPLVRAWWSPPPPPNQTPQAPSSDFCYFLGPATVAIPRMGPVYNYFISFLTPKQNDLSNGSTWWTKCLVLEFLEW